MTDLDPQLLRRTLPEWVPEFRFLAATDSTNRQALVWAAEGAPHGSVVVADYQTAGRGRLERQWVAPPGTSLLFSVVLRVRWEAEHRGLLTLAAAVAVCECLQELEIAAAIKWPNDVLLGDKKVCGILAETAGEAVVLGIGLNVKQRSFPEPINQTATSLEIHSGGSFSRPVLLSRAVAHLAALVDGPAGRIPDLYRPWCRTLGRRVRVQVPGGPIEATATGIDSTGALILDDGRVVRAGDVVHLR